MINRTALSLAAGEDRTYALKAKTAANAVLNLTGATLTWRLKDGNGGLVREVPGTVTTAALGLYSVVLSDANTELPAGDYSHETFAVISGATTICNAGILRVAGIIGRTPQILPGAVVLEADDDTQTQLFSTRTAAIVAVIAAATQFIITAGYTTVGDGQGATYKKTTAPESAVTFTSADGAVWERVRYQATVTAAPSSTGSTAAITTAFTGDWSKCQFPVAHTITGANSAGTPMTGYAEKPEIDPFYLYVDNSAGHNESTSGNDGRTGIAGFRTIFIHRGGGDFYANWVSGTVMGVRAGWTSVLANGAGVIVAGNLSGGANGVYLNPGEWLLDDKGFDIAAAGWIVNLKRTVSTAAQDQFWFGYRSQSIGTKEVDAHFSGTGKAKFGIDLSFSTFDANLAAITLKADDRMYFNVTASDATGLSRYPSAVSTTYLVYSSSLGAMHFVVGNNSALQIYSNQIIAPSSTIRSDSGFKFGNNQVVGARNTGWAAMTGSADKATVYDTASVTLAQLAGRVMNLQIALTTHGLIGA